MSYDDDWTPFTDNVANDWEKTPETSAEHVRATTLPMHVEARDDVDAAAEINEAVSALIDEVVCAAARDVAVAAVDASTGIVTAEIPCADADYRHAVAVDADAILCGCYRMNRCVLICMLLESVLAHCNQLESRSISVVWDVLAYMYRVAFLYYDKYNT